jgi:uncharacterized integral membrane protein (TIGR00698 family)
MKKEDFLNYSKKEILFILLFIASLIFNVSPAICLFTGLTFAICFGQVFPKTCSKVSKYLLQASVVGLGFGMNLYKTLESGKDGMMFTIFSVVSVIILGVIIGRILKVNKKSAFLISAGTAICGGSAIAAVAPVVKAKNNEILIALGTIFTLNAIALFIFPPIGHFFHMTQKEFGMWAAIAIHDTSSVVGAGSAYGEKALEVATMVKLTRALWIIPLSLVSMRIFREKSSKISIPWFIFIFILAVCVNTFFPLGKFGDFIYFLSKKGLSATLFIIGGSLSISVLKTVGVKPFIQGVILWIFIAIMSFSVIMLIE